MGCVGSSYRSCRIFAYRPEPAIFRNVGRLYMHVRVIEKVCGYDSFHAHIRYNITLSRTNNIILKGIDKIKFLSKQTQREQGILINREIYF